MKIIITISVILASMFVIFDNKSKEIKMQERSFYDHSINLIDGEKFELSSLKGKKLMIVNVASKCGLTSQYKALQELYDNYKDSNFEILAFPCNDFGNQEPGTLKEISEFCSVNYGVSFLVFEKISVKGENQHPLYQWLCNKSLNGKQSVSVKWNFQKFLIDEDGQWTNYLLPTTSPKSKKVISWLSN
tara:strand:+ start:337 stop:900 length:564 start_codon:yes stop_codon:yes gene_type:complete